MKLLFCLGDDVKVYYSFLCRENAIVYDLPYTNSINVYMDNSIAL